jgi:hypothetical protein
MTRERLVAVVWADARVDQADAYTREEIGRREIPTFTTFGLLVRDDPDVVAIASEQKDDGSYRGVTYILRPLVRSIQRVSEWPKRVRPKAAEIPIA